jgi:hypothetical protein
VRNFWIWCFGAALGGRACQASFSSAAVTGRVYQALAVDTVYERSPLLPMKIMLRPDLRLRPLNAFLGLLDLKTGVILAVFFAVRTAQSTQRHTLAHTCTTATEQGCGCVWNHSRRHGRRWFISANQPLRVLFSCPRRPRMGPQSRD